MKNIKKLFAILFLFNNILSINNEEAAKFLNSDLANLLSIPIDSLAFPANTTIKNQTFEFYSIQNTYFQPIFKKKDDPETLSTADKKFIEGIIIYLKKTQEDNNHTTMVKKNYRISTELNTTTVDNTSTYFYQTKGINLLYQFLEIYKSSTKEQQERMYNNLNQKEKAKLANAQKSSIYQIFTMSGHIQNKKEKIDKNIQRQEEIVKEQARLMKEQEELDKAQARLMKEQEELTKEQARFNEELQALLEQKNSLDSSKKNI